ncbi:MAG: SurA N-terminal domain-containing protein [Thermodesulfobacteriota bacterium]
MVDKWFAGTVMAFLAFFCLGREAWSAGEEGMHALPPALQAPSGPSVHDEMAKKTVVARVNGREISLATLMKRMTKIRMAKYANNPMTKELGEQLRQQALDKLVVEEVLIDAAVKESIGADEDAVAQCLVAEKNKHKDEDHFRKYLEIMQLSETDVRDECRRFLLMQGYIDRQVNQKVDAMDEKMARQLYEQSRQNFIQQEQVEVSDLMFFFDPQDASSREKAEAVRKKILADHFGDLAQLPQSGDYYIAQQVKLDKNRQPELYEIASKLEKLALSEVIVADGTLHLVQLTGYRPYKEMSYEEALPMIKNKVLAQQRADVFNAMMATLNGKAKIEYVTMDEPQ